MEKNQDSVQLEKNQLPELDGFLYALATTVVENGFSFGITLNVKGTIISGDLITSNQYFKEISKETADVENGKLLGEVLSQINRIVEEATTEQQERSSKFIHLKNARFFSASNSIPSNKGIYWRGRLSEIDGFTLGLLSD